MSVNSDVSPAPISGPCFSNVELALACGAAGASLVSLLSGGVYGATLLALLSAGLAGHFVLIPWPAAASRALFDALIAVGLALLTIRLLSAMSAPEVGPGFWAGVLCFWLAAWLLVERVSNITVKPSRLTRTLAPALFGVTLLMLWEMIARGANIPSVLLPPPSMIGAKIASAPEILWADFVQTFLKAVLAGYAMGCGAGFLAALAIDRSPFLKRGLLPIGNLFAALPVIGVAPIMVMWFGFDWQSKAAVVVAMTFFPMLVNTVAGLDAADRMQRDLMRTYAASYGQTLLKLRLPAAAPFIFNALKINSTLALIGAIVAEFFGTPIVGMGFRISTEVGRMNLDMVWAEIAVAALAGVAFYGAVALIERAATFWHPSMRK